MRHPVVNVKGFSLVETLVYMVILGILMSFIYNGLIRVLGVNISQSDVVESQSEIIRGLEILRQDMENAGFGLFWSLPENAPSISYNEPNNLFQTPTNQIPKAIDSIDSDPILSVGRDYLIIRATNVSITRANTAWGYIFKDINNNTRRVDLGIRQFQNTWRTIAIRPVTTGERPRQLVFTNENPPNFFTESRPQDLAKFNPPPPSPDSEPEKYLIYALDDDTNPGRPFNRTDYRLAQYDNNRPRPGHCALGTLQMHKGTLNHANNNFTWIPLIDCVLDFQIVYRLDVNDDGIPDGWYDASAIRGYDAKEVRDRVKEIRAYILTHEGGIDSSFTNPVNTYNVGPTDENNNILAGRTYSVTNIANWQHYRWRVYYVSAIPKNLK